VIFGQAGKEHGFHFCCRQNRQIETKTEQREVFREGTALFKMSKQGKQRAISIALVLLMALVLPVFQPALALDVVIDGTNFPDANFRAFVAQYDTSGNGILEQSELDAVKSMDCSKRAIADLTGIEHFAKLETLNCFQNQLTALDVTQNTALIRLNCYNNQLGSLDVTQNTKLKDLHCYYNKLTSLDVSTNTLLEDLRCYNNELTSLFEC
jgi:Leucine-rich repeat (LRR) protein